MFSWKLFQQCRQRSRPADSSGEKPRKLLEQRIRVRAGTGKLHVVVVLQKIQDSLVSISLGTDRNKFITRGALCRVDPKRVLGLVHLVDVHGQLCHAALEILMQQVLEAIEEIDIRSTVNILIEALCVVERRRGLRARVARKRFAQKGCKLLLRCIRGSRAGAAIVGW